MKCEVQQALESMRKSRTDKMEFIEKIYKNIKLARQCMDFQSITCANKGCINESCPLNKEYDVNHAISAPEVKG